MSNTTPAPAQIVLPAAVQHLIVPVLSILAVLGGGLPTLFSSVAAAHGNALIIAAAYVSEGGVIVLAVVTFAVTPSWFKITAAIVGVLIPVVSPFLIVGHFDLMHDGPLLLIAVTNALLTAFGQYVRTQTSTKELIDARGTNVVTKAPVAPSAITPGVE